jgi:hypothetical protein
METMTIINWTYSTRRPSITGPARTGRCGLATREGVQMFRILAAQPTWELGKWCAYALMLLVPGSLLALPVLWLLRRPPADGIDEYLAAAADHADVERRLRWLERASRGPAFVTFNH